MREKSIQILFSNSPLYRYAANECISMIEKVSPDIKVIDVTDLVIAELAGDVNGSRQLDKHLADTEIIFGRQYVKNLSSRAPKLKWVQHPMAGVENFLVKEFIDSPVILTNASGNHSQVAELVMSYMLMFSKHMPEVFRNQQTGCWIKPKKMCDVLEGKTVGIIGLGHIGTEVARFSKVFRMRVIGVRSKKTNTRYADEVYPPEQLKTVLSQSDFVVVALALTPETNKMIGKDCFLEMKRTAYIINIARGNIIDEPALIQALKDKTIAGAALDAHSVEPVPSDSELWKLSNVIITPHIGGAIVDYMQKSTLIFVANLKRYLKGQKLRNVVDKQRGH